MTTEQESNNNSSLANALTLGRSMTGQLASSTDKDWYRFTTTSAGVLNIVFDVPTSSSIEYFRLGLYDSAGVLLSLFSTGVDKTYTASAPAAGTYYLSVDAPNSYFYSGGSYNLTANHTPGSTTGFESEPNGTFATADTLALGAPITGLLSSSTDLDA
jgi:hypothetical protein